MNAANVKGVMNERARMEDEFSFVPQTRKRIDFLHMVFVFDDFSICEWLHTGIRNARNRRILNVVLTTFLYVNGLKLAAKMGN